MGIPGIVRGPDEVRPEFDRVFQLAGSTMGCRVLCLRGLDRSSNGGGYIVAMEDVSPLILTPPTLEIGTGV